MNKLIIVVAALGLLFIGFQANAQLVKYKQAVKVGEIEKKAQTIGIYEHKAGSATCYIAMNETSGYAFIPSISCVK